MLDRLLCLTLCEKESLLFDRGHLIILQVRLPALLLLIPLVSHHNSLLDDLLIFLKELRKFHFQKLRTKLLVFEYWILVKPNRRVFALVVFGVNIRLMQLNQLCQVKGNQERSFTNTFQNEVSEKVVITFSLNPVVIISAVCGNITLV